MALSATLQGRQNNLMVLRTALLYVTLGEVSACMSTPIGMKSPARGTHRLENCA
jgi:hypothetical protein